MRLISCYIENFGAIKKKEITFKNNLTSVCEENGFGKTTLASFLEAMFYGMDSDRANSKDFCMRRHFNPFAGGKYGGNIVFSVGKDVYKIERIFDEKSEVKDNLIVYKNNELYNEFGDKIGEKIFGIDKQSFERTIFIDAHEIEIGSTGSINAKLNNFIEGSTDETNTEKALERLEKAAKEYKKAKAGNDLITKENICLIEVESKISNAERIKASLPEKYERLSDYDADLKNLHKALDSKQKTELELKDWEQYDSFMSRATSAQQVLEELEHIYPFGIPSSEELSIVKEHVSAKAALEKQTNKLLPKEDAEALSALQNKYLNGTPSETDLATLREKIDSLTREETAIRLEENITLSEYEAYLRNKFTNNAPTEQTLVKLDNALDAYERAEKAYSETPDYIIGQVNQSVDEKPRLKKKCFIIAILSAIVALAGIGVAFVQMTAGIIMVAIGVICIIATGFVYLNKKTSTFASNSVQKINPEKTAKERAKNNAELEVQKLLSFYGYSSDKTIRYSVESLKNDFAAYEKLMQSDSSKNERLLAKKGHCEQLNKEISDYFAMYDFLNGNFNRRFSDLQREINRYTMLIRTRSKLNEQNADTDKMIAEHEKAISDFCMKYHFSHQAMGNINDIEHNIIKYLQSTKEYNENLKKAEQIKKEKELKVRPIPSDNDAIEEIKDKIQKLNNERSVLILEIEDCETEAEKLDDFYAEKQHHMELLKSHKFAYDLLNKTADLLKEADKRLKDKYIAPIKNNFVNYAKVLETALGEKVTMSPNFEIRYERNGIERSEKHLSAGQRSVCAFCFRMALIENMYIEEKPFLILDDPFINLDQKHMNKVKEILKNLSEKLQLIYFTCHESRAI